jgi:glycosyltransferase involved in cell wall biosynthesis
MARDFLISVVVATYNRPEALNLVLQSLKGQTDQNFEVVVADDGSRDATRTLVRAFQQNYPVALKQVWQEDIGFRAALIRNKATQVSEGVYLIYLDGDCLVQPDFVARHRALSERGGMVTGSRILLEEKWTKALCESGVWDDRAFKNDSMSQRFQGQINKIAPLWIKLPDSRMRLYKGFVWRRIKGCNMAAWRDDVLSIGGFDEGLVGWGHEDADFVFRLYQAGVRRKSGAWATEVLHLWHPSASKESAAKNAETVRARIMANAGRKLDA